MKTARRNLKEKKKDETCFCLSRVFVGFSPLKPPSPNPRKKESHKQDDE